MKTTIIELEIDRRTYRVELAPGEDLPLTAPRLVIIAYQPNFLASEIMRVCLEAIERFTPEPHETWVIDNHSPAEFSRWLLDWPGVRAVFNRTEPRSPHGRDRLRRLEYRLKGQERHPYEASYANAIGLEIAVRLVNPGCRWLFPMHMDTLPCRPGWLSFLHGQLDEQVRLAGVHLQRSRLPEGVLHVLGFLVDFQLFRQLGLDFFPRLPALDVGDAVTVRLRQAGYKVFACRDTLNQPELADLLSDLDPAKDLPVLHALDDQNRVIFMHLGRGVRKSTGSHLRGVAPQEWIEFARSKLFA